MKENKEWKNEEKILEINKTENNRDITMIIN